MVTGYVALLDMYIPGYAYSCIHSRIGENAYNRVRFNCSTTNCSNTKNTVLVPGMHTGVLPQVPVPVQLYPSRIFPLPKYICIHRYPGTNSKLFAMLLMLVVVLQM
jgi:hypothetical protein